MGRELLLFNNVTPQAPTTRDVANRIRELGAVDGLPGANRPADGASYQEVTCRSALNRVKGMPFEWTLNPYRGCTHGCHYCFARRYHTQFELGPDDQFSSIILVKKNFVEVLQRELDRPAWKRQIVAFGTATDVYQPIEGHYKITRRSLEALALARTPVGLITKGPMVVRDNDVLLAMTRRATLHRLRERADRRRGGMAGARARHCTSAAAAARRARADGCRHPRRRADESDRAGPHVAAREARDAPSRRSRITARRSSERTFST